MTARRRATIEPTLFARSPIDRAMEVVAPAARDAQELRLAAELPASVRLGTSSWSFPGWRGLVYAPAAPSASLASCGLAAYAHHPLRRTVGLDRSFYETPSLHALQELASQVPDGFHFVVKAHQACTRPHVQSGGSTIGSTVTARAHGALNGRFLDAAWAADHVVAPAVQGLAHACGPILFQFPSLSFGPREALAHQDHLLDRLHAFLSALPRGPRYAVEVRNDVLLRGAACTRLVHLLQDTGVVPALSLIPNMPGAASAVESLRGAGWQPVRSPFVLVRWLLGHQLGYQEARQRFEPFDTLAAPDVASRHEIATVVAKCAREGVESFVVVNNKAEGCAPRSIALLAASIHAELAKTAVTRTNQP